MFECMGDSFLSRALIIPRHNGTLSIIKAKHFRVVRKKVDEAVDDDVAWSCGGVMPVAFHDDVFSGLNLGFATRAAGGKVREESLSVFSSGGITSSHVGEASA